MLINTSFVDIVEGAAKALTHAFDKQDAKT